MQGDVVAERDTVAGSAGQDDLVEGLVLVRASTLKLARLQLALERRDRRVALEAVDDLVRFDESLEQHLAGLREPHAHSIMDLAVAVERAALNREKLTLAAEIISNGSDGHEAAAPVSPPEEPAPPAVSEASPEQLAEEPFPADEWADAWEENLPPRRRLWPALLVMVLVVVAAAVAFWLLDPSTANQWIAAARGMLP
jgi:hypothetical protein